ncbi:MAG: hypothetical protein H7329_15295 [Opitutaceae bacterium]|nr:hypothetical protein [Cytophagales bacterium]
MGKRSIKQEEVDLIQHLLSLKHLESVHYPINSEVSDYEGAVMRSIGLGNVNAIYAGDIIQVKYIDSDQISVIITLTQDTEGKILDLDFWKEDFSALLKYPKPGDLKLI